MSGESKSTMSYQTEEEQLAALGRLWKQYGHWILGAVALVVLSVYGYRAWMQHQHKQAEEASALYGQLTKMYEGSPFGREPLTKEQVATFDHVVEVLQKKFPHSIYLYCAQLLVAKKAMDEGNLRDAKSALKKVMLGVQDPQIKVLASIRLASVLLSEDGIGKKEAINLLKSIKKPGGYSAYYYEVLGDAQIEIGQTSEARASYQKSLDVAKASESQRPFLQMKLDNLVLLPSKEAHL